MEDVMKSYQSLWRQWLALSQTLVAPDPGDSGSQAGETLADAGAISRAMLQALSAATSSSLSYSCALQAVLYKYQASLLSLSQRDAEAGHQRALLLDEIRGFLREIGETASREGRSFQHQLTLITEQLSQAEAESLRKQHNSDNPSAQ